MAKLVVLITAQADEAREIGAAWKKAGAPGVTFVEGYGLQTLSRAAESLELLSGITSMAEILRQTTVNVVIALTLVEEDALVTKLMAETEARLGDMRAPNKGITFVLDVEQSLGVSRQSTS